MSAPQGGAAIVARYARTLSNDPGVYRMINARGDTLYVGKARALKKRVMSYARPSRHPPRIARMVALSAEMEFTLTASEAEALLLEASLIKRLRPPFNILMRDDKSFPHIALFTDHPAVRLAVHRGAQKRAGDYFGPFVSAQAVRKTLNALQRAFLLRSCSDSVYEGRSRPCLLFQIKRCSAPCTGEISLADYAALAAEARDFLKGKSRLVQQSLAAQMEKASAETDFERAALYRDRLHALEQIQSHPGAAAQTAGDSDLFAIHKQDGASCVQVFVFRGGRNLGNRAFFPRHDAEASETAILESFIAQFYQTRKPMPLVLASLPLSALLAEALALRAGRKVRLMHPKRGGKASLLAEALLNARAALARRLADTGRQEEILAALARCLKLPAPPARIEVYDNSHIQGASPVGAMIVATREGFVKNAYRLFNIKAAAAPGDDTAMMREVFSRRFSRLKDSNTPLPDLVIVDGGQPQRNAAAKTLADLNLPRLPLLAIAKGPKRNAGQERFFFADQAPFNLSPRDPLLYYLQRLRDEAHRFAVSRHRARRKKSGFKNALDSVPGVGQKRKSALLRHFGSAKVAARAAPSEIAAVEGISRQLAQTIHDHFHSQNT